MNLNFDITLTWQMNLIVYLWVAGGLGWLWGFESSHSKTMKFPGKALVVLLWPVLAAVAMLDSTWAEVKSAIKALWKFTGS